MAELPKDPSVLVLLVATNGAGWLPDVIRGLRAQRYRKTNVIAVDNASTDGSGDLLAEAFGAKNVVALDRRVGYGRALAAGLKVAAGRFRTPADAFLLVHDDAELAPGSLQAMLDTLATENTGIVGAKLVEWADASVLQDIGQTSDRYGRGVPRVEKGELDQGQHDGVYEVLYANSAVMLVAREVVETVGLFDLRYVAMRDDFDLCWRARLAGYRTLVTTDAIARHAAAAARGLREGPVARRTRYFADRNVIATLIKNYGAGRLALTLPVTILASLINVVLFLGSGKRSAALQSLEALQWNVTHLPSSLRARHRVQRARKVGDADVTRLMHHGATRLRAQFERAVERVVGEVDEGSDDDAYPPRVGLLDQLRRHPTATMILIAGFVGLIGARTMFFSGPMGGADLAPFPSSAGAFFGEFLSGWRGTGTGGAAPATPGVVLLGAFSFLCFGSTWLAERLLVLGLPVLGAIFAFRLARAVGIGSGGRRVCAITYLVSPLVLASLGEGRLGDLVLLAAAPAIVLCLMRVAGLPPADWRALGWGIVTIAVATSLAPWTLVFSAGAAIVIGATTRDRLPGYIGRAAAMIAGALVLLLPWSVELFRPGSPIGSGGGSPGATMLEILGLSPTAIDPVPQALRYGSLAAVIGAILLPASVRPRRTGAFAALAFAGVAGAWAVGRGVPWIAPRASLPLIAAAVAVAVLAAMAFDGAGPLLSARQFGARHVLAGVIGALVVLQIGAGAVWVARGTHPGIGHGHDLVPTFLASEARQQGEFRIAWIGGRSDAPAAALTGPEGTTMLKYLTRPAGGGHDEFRRVVAAIASGRTQAGGRLLAQLGVRYVITRPRADERLIASVAQQADLTFIQRFQRTGEASIVWRNTAAMPVAAPAPADRTARSPLFAPRASAKGLRKTGPAAYEGRAAKGVSALTLAEDYSPRWRAITRGKAVGGSRSFGWATAMPVGPGRVEVRWQGNLWHRLTLAFEAFLILMFVGEWSRRAARERGER